MIGCVSGLAGKAKAVQFYDTLGTRYEGAVERLGELEVINGTGKKVFSPEKTVTRAEFAKMIVEATLTKQEMLALVADDSHCHFKDISSKDWYYSYVVAATNYGYIQGYQDGTFRPTQEVTYQEISKMLMKALGHNYLVETDARGWAAEYMDKMYALKITKNTAPFEEKEPATRGNVAILLYNTLTSHVWEKIYLNDVAGFTYVDSGASLLGKKFKKYIYQEDFKITGFKEINGELYVGIDQQYYRLEDQDYMPYFFLIGGKGEALLKRVRDINGYSFEVVGLSADLDATFYEGTKEQLKKENHSISLTNSSTASVGNGSDYAYLFYKEDEEKPYRILNIKGTGEHWVVDQVKIETKKTALDADDKKESDAFMKEPTESQAYEKRALQDQVEKTIRINNNYEIADGAVLFYNNQRVEWKSLQKGDILTEVEKDKYYFISRNVVESLVDSYQKEGNIYTFATERGTFITYNDTKCLGYLAPKVSLLRNQKEEFAQNTVGKNVKFYLDFLGRVVRLDVMEDDAAEDTMQETGIGIFYDFFYTEKTNNKEAKNRITVMQDGKKKTYYTTVSDVNAKKGSFILLTFESPKVVSGVKVLSSNSKISNLTLLKEISYKNYQELVEDGFVVNGSKIYCNTYVYDFGEYDKVIDIETNTITKEKLDSFDKDKIKIFAVCDNEDRVLMTLVQDYSNQKELFYGKVNKIYMDKSEKSSKLKIEISVFQHKDMVYDISGLLNCEEGDIISFKIVKKEVIQVMERFSPEVLGYYQDLIVEDVEKGAIKTNKGTIHLQDEKIKIGQKEYLLEDYVFILTYVAKDSYGDWQIGKSQAYEREDVSLRAKDRIAIDEIENTFIIYRGYEDEK